MKFDRKLFKITLVAISLLCFVSTALRLAVYWKEVDGATGFFSTNGTFCSVYNVIAFVVFGICILLTLKKGGQKISESTRSHHRTAMENEVLSASDDEAFFYKEEPIEPVRESLPSFPKKTVCWQGTLSAFASILPGFSFFACAIAMFFSGQTLTSYHTLFILLSVLSGAYFIHSAFSNSAVKNKIRPFFALCPAFWCTVRMVVEYRDLVRYVNKSLYIGQFLFIIATLLFFLYQAQLLVGEKTLSRPNAYAFSALAVLFLGISCRIPHLIAVLGDQMAVDIIDATSLLIDLSILFFALIKVKTILED